MHRFTIAFLFAIAMAGQAAADFQCTVTLAISPEIERVTSIAKAENLTFGNRDGSVQVYIDPHTLDPVNLRKVASGAGYASTALSHSPFLYETTYVANTTCIGMQAYFEVYRKTATTSGTTPVKLPNYKDIEPRNCEPIWDAEGMTWLDPECNTPVLLDLGGVGYRLTSAADGVLFDIRSDGKPRQIAWTQVGMEIAFLAHDRNGDGKIDSGAELFGDATPLISGGTARHGFEALSEFDQNGDGLISEQDEIWSSLVLWVDRNHDGVSKPSELSALSSTDVEWIAVNFFDNSKRRDRWGNAFRYVSQFGLKSAHGSERSRLFFDVLLVGE